MGSKGCSLLLFITATFRVYLLVDSCSLMLDKRPTTENQEGSQSVVGPYPGVTIDTSLDPSRRYVKFRRHRLRRTPERSSVVEAPYQIK